MTLIKQAIAALIVAAAAQSAHAAVIPTVGGFVPLQYTKNLSINDFYAGVGGWNEKYHLASQYEINVLLSRYQITAHTPSPFTSNEYDFIYNIGGHTLGPYGTYFSDGAQGAIGRSIDSYVSVGISNGENTQPYGACPSFRECASPTIQYAWQSYAYKDDRSGLFLVEGSTAVPEPASLALVALGLSALALRRRQR